MSGITSLRSRIILGFATIVLLVTFISVWTIGQINEIRNISATVINQNLGNVEDAGRMLQAMQLHHRGVLLHLSGSPDSARHMTSRAAREFYAAYHHARQTGGYGTTGALERIGHDYHEFSVAANELFAGNDTMRDGIADPGAGYRQYLISLMPLHDAIIADISTYRNRSFERSTAGLDAVSEETRFAAYSIAVVAGLVLMLVVVGSWKVTQTFLAPVMQLTHGVKRIAEGDFEQKIEIADGGRELEMLGEHFNAMAQRLKEHDAMKVEQIMEEKIRCEQMIRDLPDVIVATDELGRVIYFNHQAERIIGLSASLLLGRDLSELVGVHPLLRRMSEQLERRELRSEDTVAVLVSGSERDFSFEGAAICDDDGIIGHVFRLQDIARFRQVDRIRSKIISTVTHELRTPLTSMGMSLELLIENSTAEGTDPLQRQLLVNMQEDVRRLQSFAGDLLDLSDLEEGRLELQRIAVSPRLLAETAMREMAPLATPHEIRIDVTGVPSDLPPVLADPHRITQVLNNLLGNAIRYTPFCGTISIDAALDDGMIRFAVRDHGPGVPVEEAEQVFDRFYQIRDDQRAAGSGLGLAIVKEVVEVHGGRVWVESALGEGSSFYFTLPQHAGSVGNETRDERVDLGKMNT